MNEMNEIDEQMLENVCGIIRQHNVRLESKMQLIVAEMCNVDASKMMTERKSISELQARWLYWYALRYMTQDSYRGISEKSNHGHKFAVSSVCSSISKMSDFISQGTIWTKRWMMLKKIIKEYMKYSPKQQEELFTNNVTITITHPKGVNVELKEI